MSDWSQDLLRRLKEKAEGKAITDVKAIQDKQVLTDGMTSEWAKFKTALKQRCEEFNEEQTDIQLHVGTQGDTKVTVSRSDTGAMIIGETDFVGPWFNFIGEKVTYERKIGIRLTMSGQGVFLTDKKGKPLPGDMERIAPEIIEALLGL